jgi:pimeloyl-ACP methyl ester carboxylesterase
VSDAAGPSRIRRWLRRLATALVIVALGVTVASMAYNVVTRGREKPAAALYGGPFVTLGGRSIAYRTWGTRGTPIVLLGGFAESSWVWHDVGPLLGRRHRVYAIDLPPFGYSQRRGPYTLAEWVGIVDAFDRSFGLAHPVLVGHSLGAAVAVAAALRHPGGPSRIVLLDGDALAAGGGAGVLAHLLVDPYYTSLFRLLTGSDFLVRRVVRNAMSPAPAPVDQVSLQEWKRPFRVEGTPAAFRSLASHGLQGVHAADLRRVTVPASVVWGAGDTVDPVSAGRASAAALHAPFVLIAGAGHLSMLGRPAAVARAIERGAR